MRKFTFKEYKRLYFISQDVYICWNMNRDVKHGVEKIAGCNGVNLKYKLYYITCVEKWILYLEYILINWFYNFMNGCESILYTYIVVHNIILCLSVVQQNMRVTRRIVVTLLTKALYGFGFFKEKVWSFLEFWIWQRCYFTELPWHDFAWSITKL